MARWSIIPTFKIGLVRQAPCPKQGMMVQPLRRRPDMSVCGIAPQPKWARTRAYGGPLNNGQPTTMVVSPAVTMIAVVSLRLKPCAARTRTRARGLTRSDTPANAPHLPGKHIQPPPTDRKDRAEISA